MFSIFVISSTSSFERKFDAIKEEKGIEFDTDLTAEDLKEVVAIYKEEYKKHAGVDFPQDPKEQLMEAIKAVFRSWNNDRAITMQLEQFSYHYEFVTYIIYHFQ